MAHLGRLHVGNGNVCAHIRNNNQRVYHSPLNGGPMINPKTMRPKELYEAQKTLGGLRVKGE